jgi:hypothetical protein
MEPTSDTIAVQVKWRKKKFDVNVRLDASPDVLKDALYDLTGVAPDRQKIAVGAKQITSETNLRDLKLREKQVIMLFGTSEETLKVPEGEAKEFGSPNNVCDLFHALDIRNHKSPKEIGDELYQEGFDYMQVANCLIICRPKTTEDARKWIEEHKDGAATTHIVGQPVPDFWASGVEYSFGKEPEHFQIGEVVVLNRSDGSVRFGVLMQLSVYTQVEEQMHLFPDTFFVLVEYNADSQGRGTMSGKAVKVTDIGKLQLVEHAHGIPPLELEEKGEESSTTRSEVSEL